MLTLAAVALAATCSLPSDARIILEADDPVCSTYEICAPGAPIRFKLTSSDECEEFLWIFPDGTTSAEREPLHAFTTADYHVVQLLAGISRQTIGVDTRPDRLAMYALAASPVESAVHRGETITFTVMKKFLPNQGIFTISCGGALECEHATIGMNETSVTFTATAVRTGAGGLSYFVSTFGRPQGGGPFAVVRVTEPPPAKRRSVRR